MLWLSPFLSKMSTSIKYNMSGKNIADGKIKLYDHTDNNRFRICFFR